MQCLGEGLKRATAIEPSSPNDLRQAKVNSRALGVFETAGVKAAVGPGPVLNRASMLIDAAIDGGHRLGAHGAGSLGPYRADGQGQCVGRNHRRL